jgi:uncharacterized membrane protein YeaQ/YmgE (transglycosylase-associated protein family)
VGSILAGIIAGALGYAKMFAIIAIFPAFGGVVYFLFTRKKVKTY